PRRIAAQSADRTGIRLGNRLGTPSLADRPQICDPAGAFPTKFRSIECADHLEQIGFAVSDPADWAVMIENRLDRAISNNDQRLESGDRIADRAASGEVVRPAVQGQTHDIDLLDRKSVV